jgi:hypothetical protein
MVGGLVDALFFLQMVLVVTRLVSTSRMSVPPIYESGFLLPSPASAVSHEGAQNKYYLLVCVMLS